MRPETARHSCATQTVTRQLDNYWRILMRTIEMAAAGTKGIDRSSRSTLSCGSCFRRCSLKWTLSRDMTFVLMDKTFNKWTYDRIEDAWRQILNFDCSILTITHLSKQEYTPNCKRTLEK
jgi:hypothetical protein